LINGILIDKGREAPNRKQNLLKMGIPFKEEQLLIGDYLLGDYCIEYKCWEDFYASIMDGRLFEQARNMESYKHPLIAVVGDKYKSLFKMNMYRGGRTRPEDMIRSALVALYRSFNVSVMMFTDDKDFCKFLGTLYHSLNSDKKKYRPVYHKRKPKDINEVRENVFCEVPGISVGKAKIILKNYDYDINKVLADIDNITDIKGIGKKLQESIAEVFKLNLQN